MLELKISSPATVVEGESYSVRLTVTNQSTKAGVPTEAMLRIAIEAIVSLDTWVTETLIPTQEREEHFSPGQTRTFNYTMNIPLGLAGYSGSIGASVMDPTGLIILDSASEPLIIEAVPIIPGVANLYGTLTDSDTGYTLPGVKVSTNSIVTYSGSNGEYRIEGLTPGLNTITFEKFDYETKTPSIVLVEGDNELSIHLVPIWEPTWGQYQAGVRAQFERIKATPEWLEKRAVEFWLSRLLKGKWTPEKLPIPIADKIKALYIAADVQRWYERGMIYALGESYVIDVLVTVGATSIEISTAQERWARVAAQHEQYLRAGDWERAMNVSAGGKIEVHPWLTEEDIFTIPSQYQRRVREGLDKLRSEHDLPKIYDGRYY